MSETANQPCEGNILQRVIAVRNEVRYIQKDKEVDTGRGKYKAVTHDMVTAMVRESMNKHGIVVIPFLVETDEKPPVGDSKQFRHIAVYDFKFCNAEDATDFFVVRTTGHAMDNADKAPGKALSYAKKYAILKVFEIETGENEESRNPDEFDVMPWILQIEQAGDLDKLQAIYGAAIESAGSNDEATRAIIASCSAAKKRIAKAK